MARHGSRSYIQCGRAGLPRRRRESVLAGVSIPFPVFDMNRAGVRRAGHEYNAAMLDKTRALLFVRNGIGGKLRAFCQCLSGKQDLERGRSAWHSGSVRCGAYQCRKIRLSGSSRRAKNLVRCRKQAIQTMLDYYRAMAVIDRMTAIHSTQTQKEKTP